MGAPGPSDPARARELLREQSHLDRVHARLDQLRAEASAFERSSLGVDLDGTPQGLYERDVTAFHAAVRRLDLEVPDDGAVFGRLDRLGGEVLHVGRLGVRTPDQEPLVVDWRAPAAAPFYQATMVSPLGVVRRRNVVCRGRRVVNVEDELLDLTASSSLEGSVVGEGAFFDLLARERSGHMRDIVATIQREQDRAVRAPDDGALLVTGGPGTGKTAVALHRVAYLMYQRRELYSRRGVLVVGPTPTFVEYVSHVLPSLGEASVAMHSLASLPVVPPGFSVTARDVPAVEVVKGSTTMAGVLRRVVSHLGAPAGLGDVELSWRGTALVLPAARVSRRRSGVVRSARPHNLGREAFASALAELAWEAWVTVSPAPDEDEHDRFLEEVVSAPRFVSALDRLWPVLDVEGVWEALTSSAVPLARLARGVLGEDAVELLLSSWDPSSRVLTPADAALLDELGALVGPVPVPVPDPEDEDEGLSDDGYPELSTLADRLSSRPRRVEPDRASGFGLTVVDEVQDVSPMQWRVVARRSRGGAFTLVGDWQQASLHDPQEVRTAMGEAVGRSQLARLREVSLEVNYRTSAEVALLAARVLEAVDPEAVPPRAVRTTGVEPEERLGNPLDQVATSARDLLLEVSGTVAVVCPSALAGPVRARLEGLLSTHPRLSVVDTWEAKGLEFDAVAVLAPDRVVSDGVTRAAGLRSLYVAVSRGAHRLHLLCEVPLDEVLAP